MNVTQRDLAREAGVSLATVARVLRNNPGVAAATREKVLRAVRATGYRPNPLVDAWATQFREAHRRTGLVIGHVTGFSKNELEANPGLRTLRDGIRTRAAEIGASVDTFHAGPESGISAQRLQGILRGRGIPALLYGPFPLTATGPDLRWEEFSIVGIGESPPTQRVHRAVHSRYLTLRKAVGKLLDTGFKRPGLAGFGPAGSESSRGWLPAFLQMASRLRKKDQIPWLPLETADFPRFDRWLRRYQPDVVLSPILQLAERVRPPEDPDQKPADAFFGLDMHESATARTVSGIIHPHRYIGRGAVDLVVAQSDYFETGLPSHPRKVAYWGTIH